MGPGGNVHTANVDPFLLLGLGVVAMIGVLVVSYVLKVRRREAMAQFAAKYGFVYTAHAPPGLLAYGFPLFFKGDGRGAENGVIGEWKGMPFKAADFWYYTESTDSKGNRSKNYSRFSVAVIELEAWLPDIAIHRENVFTLLGDKLGMKDIDFESEEFNRAFQVKAKDRKFAFELVDPRMMQWLLSCDRRFGFEIHGKGVLIYSKTLKPTEMLPLIATLKEFRERVPRLVWTNYGTASASGAGAPATEAP